MKILRLVAINLLVLLGLLLLVEAANQALGLVHPSYDVLFLEPDRAVGWKQVPNLHWTWARPDFRVAIETNPQGFRDLARAFEKPGGARRVALLGDSYIEAVQVPLAETAGQLLESRLNEAGGGSGRPRWEVLNFAISGYSVGQYLLAWETYARRYEPDLVVIFVSWLQARRTAARYEFGSFGATKKDRLWIRPTFRLENGSLVREPARDFDEFVRIQQALIDSDFGGSRTRRRRPPLISASFARRLKTQILARPVDPLTPLPERAPSVDPAEALALNRRVLQELGRQVSAAGATLLVADASQYLGDDGSFSGSMAALCAEEGFEYLAVSEKLLAANKNGIATHWPHDLHFNQAGNRVLADALSNWIVKSFARR